MENSVREKMFFMAMWWRIFYGVVRVVVGLAILKLVNRPILDLVHAFTRNEMVEDPHDVAYTFLTHFLTTHPLYVTYFLAGYFIFWGVVDIFLSYNLLKHRLWAFPFSLIVMGLFIIYEIVRFSHNHSLILLGVMCLDILITWLVWREYRSILQTQQKAAP